MRHGWSLKCQTEKSGRWAWAGKSFIPSWMFILQDMGPTEEFLFNPMWRVGGRKIWPETGRLERRFCKHSDICVRFYHSNKQSKISVVYKNKYSFPPKLWCLITTNIYFLLIGSVGQLWVDFNSAGLGCRLQVDSHVLHGSFISGPRMKEQQLLYTMFSYGRMAGVQTGGQKRATSPEASAQS